MLAYLFRYRHEQRLFLEHPAVPLANVRQHRVVVQLVKVGFCYKLRKFVAVYDLRQIRNITSTMTLRLMCFIS